MWIWTFKLSPSKRKLTARFALQYPDVINNQPRLIADSLVVPDEALNYVPQPLLHAV